MTSHDFDHAIERIEARFERLRTDYEDFFAGLGSQEPSATRAELAREIERLRLAAAASPEVQRRIQNVAERFRGFEQYWERRSGRVARAVRQRQAGTSAVAGPAPAARLTDVPSSGPISGVLPSARARLLTPPLGTPSVLSPATRAAPAPAQLVISERVRQVHAKLQACSPGQPRVSIERLAKALADTEAKLRAQHGDRTITFDVVVQNGKAVVKPVVR